MCCNEKHSPPLPRGKNPPTCTKQIKPLSSERLLPVLCSILVIHLLKILLTKAEQKQLNLQRAELCSPLQKPYTDLPQIPLRKHSKGCFSNWGAGISFLREKSHYLVIRVEKSLSTRHRECSKINKLLYLVHFKIRFPFSENLYAKLQPDANWNSNKHFKNMFIIEMLTNP